MVKLTIKANIQKNSTPTKQPTNTNWFKNVVSIPYLKKKIYLIPTNKNCIEALHTHVYIYLKN